MKFNKEMFERFKLIYAKLGFEKSKYYEHNGVFDFIREKGECICWVRMTVGLKTDGFGMIHGKISFKGVVEKLKIFDNVKLDFNEEVLINYDLYKDKDNWNNIYKRLATLPLKTALNIEEFEKIIISHVNSYILPFFEKFPTTQSVNDKILNSFPKEEYANYIPGQTNFKALIIMKLCNNPKYVDFKKWALTAYKKGVEINSARYSKDYEVLKLLVGYLDNIVPTP
jgi:hypothetical protein